MARRRWLGAAASRRQVVTIAISGTWVASDTITLTINNVDFVVTIGSLVTTAQVATTLKQAFNGETLDDTTASYSPNLSSGAQDLGMFAEIEASVSSSTVTFTARTEGVPFTMTSAESAASGSISQNTTVTCTGPNFFSNQDNWSGNTVPVDGDDLVFDSGSVDLLYDLSPAIQPGSVTITMGYTGSIGLDDTNSGPTGNSGLAYPEYRTKKLTFDDNSTTCTVYIGDGAGTGSGRVRIDFGAGRTDVIVTNTGSRSSEHLPAFEFTGTNANNTFTIFEGDAGAAVLSGDSTTIATLRVGSNPNSTAKFYAGRDATLTTVVQSGGVLDIYASCTTLTQHAGITNQMAGAPATVAIAGTYNDRSNTTIGTGFTIHSGGIYDRSGDNRPKTITPLANLHKDSSLLDPNASLTLTAGFKLNGCTIEETKLDFGRSRTYTVA